MTPALLHHGRTLFDALLNTLWLIPLLSATAWLLVRIIRPRARTEHSIWLVTLALAIVLPLLPAARPVSSVTSSSLKLSASALARPEPDGTVPLGEPLLTLHAVAATEASPGSQPTDPAASSKIQRRTSIAQLGEHFAAQLAEQLAERFQRLRVQCLTLPDRAVRWFLNLYAVSIALSLVRFTRAYLAARTIVAKAVAHPLTGLESALVHRSAEALGLRERGIPQLRFVTDPAACPCVFGVRHPVLLLPESLRHSSPDELHAVLLHEFAHIRRRDVLIHLVSRLAATPLDFHPATHLLLARLARSREQAADALAAQALTPALYARSILTVATRILSPAPSYTSGFLHFTSSRHTNQRILEERIMSLITPPLSTPLTLRVARITTGAALLMATGAAAATIHLHSRAPAMLLAQAQAAPPAPAAVPPPIAPTAPAPPAPGGARAHAQAAPRAARKPEPLYLLNEDGVVTIDGVKRELTPDERAKREAELNAASEEIRRATAELRSPEFQKSMDELARSVAKMSAEASQAQWNSPEFKEQMEKLKLQVISPKDSAALGKQLGELKIRIDSTHLREQLDAARQVEQAHLLSSEELAKAHAQLDAARRQIAEARKQINDGKIQQQLDEAQRQIEQAINTF